MALRIIRNGIKEPYSEEQLRKDNPCVSFPRNLVGVDLSLYGVEVVPSAAPNGAPRTVDAMHAKRTVSCVPMHCFMYGIREFGLRVQFERYVLAQQGHARDYWLLAPYVSRTSTYVQHAAVFFGLSEADLDNIFATADFIEE